VTKLVPLPGLLLAGCLIAATYGAAHNQVSYTVSPALFDRQFFSQYGIPDGLPERAGAGLVGVYATWWVGLVIGPPVVLAGHVLLGRRGYARHVLVAFAVAAGTAAATGLAALAVALLTIDEHNFETSFFALSPSGSARANQALAMHDGSYAGGGLGVLAGVGYIVAVRVRQQRAAAPSDGF
jgi:hypothetical protein